MVSKRLLIGQRIALGFLVPLIALILIGSFSLRNLEQLQSDTQWVTHTVEVISELRVFTGAFSRIESAGRGYMISADDALRADIEDGYKTAFSALERLRNLTNDNSAQTVRIDRLTVLLTRRAELSRSMAGFQASQGTKEQSLDLLRQGVATAREVTSITDAMNVEESKLLTLRREASAHALMVTRGTVVYGSLGALLFVTIGGLMLARSITAPLTELQTSATRIGNGEYGHRVRIAREDEIGHLGDVFNTMARQVEERQKVLADQDWLKSALAKFNALFQQQRDPAAVCTAVLNELSSLVHVQASAIYLASFDDATAPLRLGAAFAADNLPAEIKPGDGLVGEAFAENRRFILDETPPDYFRIGSALGRAKPACLLIEPVAFEGRAVAVMELASFTSFKPHEQQLVAQLAPSLGIVLQTIAAIRVTERLLKESQELGSALAAQRQSLADKNGELEVQAERLRKSEAQLQEQQVELQQSNEELEQSNEELQQSNEEMEEKSNMLAEQKRELEDKNRAIEQARREVQEQARQLAVTSKYKSDFLATMSHELRTPLNSLLILARLLGENRDANLTAKQVQFAQTIASSGTDLLEMINQILDLAKIESGTVELEIEDVPAHDLERSLEHQFRQLAVEKKLNFGTSLAPNLPPSLRTDPRRLNQILKNLLSNAFKFTEKGGITVTIKPATDGWPRSNFSLERAKGVIAIAVTDTGIGISPDKQRLVFESFQQADAGTSRRFGGTGLGLSISRELAALLGGALTLESELGKGSTFTLFVPTAIEGKSTGGTKPSTALPAPAEPKTETPIVLEEMDESGVEDDRKGLVPGQRAILIIEDDNRFARILVDFAREKGFKALVASSAHAGMALAQRYLPVAITLDLRLSDEGGWVVLDRLKHDERTRHIPVHLISVEPARERGLKLGAVSFLQKPVTREAIDEILQQTVEFIDRPMKNLLVVEDNAVQRQTICELIGNGDVHTTAVATAGEALEELAKGHYDCIVLDLMLPDKPGVELIREINKRMGSRTPPVIIYTGKELSPKDETELRSLSDSIIVKDARSPERLLDETALFLHRVQARLPEAKRRMLEQVRKQDAILTGRRVLVVDDDVRNIFALTAALEAYGMLVRFAESGQAALTMLQDDANCDVVLMDVMMPGMDGYETIRRIREVPKFGTLPIIAVTAKAMKGDRERCIDAGASDYITKPVITEKLLSLLRVWLYR